MLCRVLDGYTVSGKIRELDVKKVGLLSFETGHLDTLRKIVVTDGVFLFKGRLGSGSLLGLGVG